MRGHGLVATLVVLWAIMSRNNKKLANKKKQKQQPDHPKVIQQSKSIHFSGPIPPPDILERYDQISPGSAERILAMAEQEAEHTSKIESTLVQQRGREVFLGQIFGFSIGIISIAAGAYIVISGHPVSGAVIGSVGVVGLVSAFIMGREQK